MTAAIRHGVALAVVALLAGTVFGQAQDQNQKQKNSGRQDRDQQPTQQQQRQGQRSSRDQSWQQITQEMQGSGITLDDAISKATDKVGGTAISARIIPTFTAAGQAERYGSEQVSPYRVEVLCRTTDGKFRVVTIDGQSGNVIGTSYASAPHRMGSRAYARSERGMSRSDWQIGEQQVAVFRLIKCSALKDTKIKNEADKDLGHIQDFAVDPQSGRISYAAVSFGGFLGMGDKLFAVPLDAFEVVTPDRVVLDVTKKELENAQGFNEDKWPVHANQRWAADLRSGGPSDIGRSQESELVGHEEREEASRQGRESRQRITSIEKASDLIGKKVKNPQGEELGKVEDLYVDPDRDRVCFAVLSYGGVLGVGDKLFAVPWQSFDMGPKHEYLVLDVDKSRLENAPKAEASDRDTWNDPDWAVIVYRFYNVEPYWQRGAQDSSNEDSGGNRGGRGM